MRNKLLVLLSVMTLFLFICIDRANATVMWMQCGKMQNNKNIQDDGYEQYNTFALIDNMGKGTRHLLYSGSDFFAVKGPTFVNYQKSGNLCWYNNEYEKDSGPMSDCDKTDDFVGVEKLLGGVCPEAVYHVTRSGILPWDWFVDTAGATQGDFTVLQGTKSNYGSAEINSPKMVMYKFHDSDTNKDYWMIEAYNSAGVYGFIHTYVNGNDDYEDLAKKMGLWADGGDDNDVFDEDGDQYDNGYVDWTMYTQIYRLWKLGSDYFKITENDKALMIGVGERDTRTFSLIDSSKIYYDESISGKTTESSIIKDWYSENAELYAEETKVLRKFQSGGDYANLIKISEKISDAVDKGMRYDFTSEYSPSTMAKELGNAYKDLESINVSNKFAQYDDYCQKTGSTIANDSSVGAAFASAYGYFSCHTFGVPDIEKTYTKNKSEGNDFKNVDMVILTMQSYIQNQLNKLSGIDMDATKIQDLKESYLVSLAKAASYIMNNGLVDESEIKDTYDGLLKLAESYGYQIVVDCESLIGDELKTKLDNFFGIFRIAVPIILIGMGIIDFTKALFAGDEDKMKKAQSDFIKRLGIAILFFLTPTIVDLLLSIANKVWNFISPNSCNIF